MNKKADTIFKAIKHVYQTYAKRGFKLKILMMDGEFDKDGLNGEVVGLSCNFNAVARKEHVPEIKRNIRTTKDRNYGHLHATLESITMTQHGMQKVLQLFGKAG